MDEPVFPKEFVLKHCPKVMEARDWASEFDKELPEEEQEGYAECAFNPAGAGMMCESCRMHLTRPFLHHEVDRKWLPVIEQYYRDLETWEAEQEKTEMDHARKAIESMS